MTIELPLFPLNAVLFPHTAIALNIFEPRYQRLLADCRQQGTGFGIVAIAQGHEVGGYARPHRVGSLATFTSVEMLEDGRANVAIRGATRFAIESLTFDRPYLVGAVRWLAEETGEPQAVATISARVRPSIARYAAGLHRLTGWPEMPFAADSDPERLAYQVCAMLQIDVAERQALLEADTILARLRRCQELLRRELVLLDQMLAHRGKSPSLVSPN